MCNGIQCDYVLFDKTLSPTYGCCRMFFFHHKQFPTSMRVGKKLVLMRINNISDIMIRVTLISVRIKFVG